MQGLRTEGAPCLRAHASSFSLDASYSTSTELPSDVGVTTSTCHGCIPTAHIKFVYKALFYLQKEGAAWALLAPTRQHLPCMLINTLHQLSTRFSGPTFCPQKRACQQPGHCLHPPDDESVKNTSCRMREPTMDNRVL